MPPKKGPSRIYKLPRLLDNSPDPIAVINDQFRVVYANQACCNWLGVTGEDLVGKVLTYSSAGQDNDKSCNGICPSPQLFSGEREKTMGQIHVIRGGQRVFKNATFCRIQTEDDDKLAALVVATGDDYFESGTESSASEQDWHDILAKMKKAETAIFNAASLVGTSDHALRIRRQVAAVAENQADCLMIGPVGSGREHVARTIFAERNLPKAQLVPIHCSIADSELIQSAIKNWVFDRRSNDSSDWLLLLDVDQLSVDAQSELLGYTRLPDFQMPIMATASDDLMKMATAGNFSKSLAMHLSIQTIELSPLSQRMQDLPLLVQAFIEQNNVEQNNVEQNSEGASNQVAAISDEALSSLGEYDWPRNVAELKQYIEAAHNHCKSATIQLPDLPEEFNYALSAAQIGHFQLRPINLSEYLEQIEKELITRALAQSGNNKTKAARLLGISRARLLRRCTSLAIQASSDDQNQITDEIEFREAD